MFNSSLIKSYPGNYLYNKNFKSLEKLFLLCELLNSSSILNNLAKNSYTINEKECIQNGYLNLDNFYMHKYLSNQFKSNPNRLLYILLNAEKSINYFSQNVLNYPYHTLKFLRNKYVFDYVVSNNYNEFFKNTLSDAFKYHSILFEAKNMSELDSLKYYINLNFSQRKEFEDYVAFTYIRHLYYVISRIKKDKPLLYLEVLKSLNKNGVTLYI